MLRKSWYLEAMEDANIPLTKREKLALEGEKEVLVGKFNEKSYIRRLKRMGVPLTNHQTYLMKVLALAYDEVLKIRVENDQK